MKVATYRIPFVQSIKLLVITALLLPSLVPAGFMAHRNADTKRLEITLCPSDFSQVAINALSGSVPTEQSDLAHHVHHSPLGETDEQSSGMDHSSHQKEESAELCPLGGAGVFVGFIAEATDFRLIFSSVHYTEPLLAAETTALLPPPGRGPPALS
ncbi:MAG: hypothetical protein HOI74_09310 [Gammaproteobacteria bacterium]|nr:hypothetical protein [Gammaproteobacteria bacterium]